MKWNRNVPFDAGGNQLHWPEFGDGFWKENSEFEDTLVYEGYQRGRSAAYFLMRRQSTGARVVVFMTDFESMVPKMVRGKIKGTFTFCKRGQNFGCRLVDGEA